MFEHDTAWPHGKLQRAFSEVFYVVGTNKTRHDGVDLQTSRTMTVLRQDRELTLLNTVRLSEEGLRELDALGGVRHVVRLGAFHGRDDRFYRDRYGATLWALPGVATPEGQTADRELAAGESLPGDGAVFVFTSARFPEAAVLVPSDGGVLITCDAVQNWTHIDPFFSEETAALFVAQGLIGAANIPSTWRAACRPDVADFRRLAALPFRHLITGHGEPLRDDAKRLLTARVDEVFGSRGTNLT
jgi:hypothetical protein